MNGNLRPEVLHQLAEELKIGRHHGSATMMAKKAVESEIQRAGIGAFEELINKAYRNDTQCLSSKEGIERLRKKKEKAREVFTKQNAHVSLI